MIYQPICSVFRSTDRTHLGLQFNIVESLNALLLWEKKKNGKKRDLYGVTVLRFWLQTLLLPSQTLLKTCHIPKGVHAMQRGISFDLKMCTWLSVKVPTIVKHRYAENYLRGPHLNTKSKEDIDVWTCKWKLRRTGPTPSWIRSSGRRRCRAPCVHEPHGPVLVEGEGGPWWIFRNLTTNHTERQSPLCKRTKGYIFRHMN